MNENPDELDSFMGKNKVATHNINSNFFYYVKTKLKNCAKMSRFIRQLLCNFFGILLIEEPIVVCFCWIMSLDSRYDHENFLRVCHTFHPKKQVGIALTCVAFHCAKV